MQYAYAINNEKHLRNFDTRFWNQKYINLKVEFDAYKNIYSYFTNRL